MLVGAGTVMDLAQCKHAVELGARFIVSAGLDEEVVRWCVENQVPVTPGIATPTEIMAAMKLGLRTLKFFPANVYGGLPAMKALSGAFRRDQVHPHRRHQCPEPVGVHLRAVYPRRGRQLAVHQGRHRGGELREDHRPVPGSPEDRAGL